MGGSNHLRSLQVPITITLGRLYRVIQAAMGWTDNHLREFIIGDEQLGIPDLEDVFLPYPLCPEICVKLDVALMGRRHFDYLHDFGDDWAPKLRIAQNLGVPEHEATLEWCGGSFDRRVSDVDQVNALSIRIKQ